MICPECGLGLRFNAEFTYRKEGKKYKNRDWYYCDNCNINYEERINKKEEVK